MKTKKPTDPKFLSVPPPPFRPVAHPIIPFLETSVPLRVYDMQREGPTEDDFNKARSFAQELVTKGDVLLYGGKGAGDMANKAAHAVAVLSFCPGGVTLFGNRWQSSIQNTSESEASNK